MVTRIKVVVGRGKEAETTIWERDKEVEMTGTGDEGDGGGSWRAVVD